tara:strand:+ start:232 stop:423 length:192 start_codon:yes stop_codon:yes gene_type:complete
MKKYILFGLLLSVLLFSNQVFAHCGDAEAHAAASKEHIEKGNKEHNDNEKESNAYKNKMSNRY